MNSGNSKTSNPHRLLVNLSDKINLKRSDKYAALSNLAFTMHGETYKNTKIINLKYQLQHGLPDGSYSRSVIQDYFEYLFKKHGERLIILQ